MSAWERVLRFFAPSLAFLLVVSFAAFPAPAVGHEADGVVPVTAAPVHVIPGPAEVSTLYYDGSEIVVQTE